MVGEQEENMVVVQKTKWLGNKNQDGWCTRDNTVGDSVETMLLEKKIQDVWKTKDNIVGEQETRRLENKRQED